MLLKLPCGALDIGSPKNAIGTMLKMNIPFRYVVRTGYELEGLDSKNLKIRQVKRKELVVEAEACKCCASLKIGRCNLPVGKALRHMSQKYADKQR